MTAVASAWERPVAAFPAARLRVARLGWVLFALALAGYLALGAYIALVLHAMHGDAYSRVTNASYVYFSRDPHLAAIGFVWPPLPTLFELALVPLKVVWPPMVEQGFAAVIMSAVFMAGAVYQLSRTLDEFGVPRLARFLLVAAFALHPLIVYYGVIGTSEAPTVFFLLLTARYLARWIRERAVDSLVLAGVGLAGAYLTRYEAVLGAVGVAALTAVFALAYTDGRARRRLDAAVADLAILLAPLALVVIGWALASWLIVGSPIASFTSAYGASSQLSVASAGMPSEQLQPLAVKGGLALLRLTAVNIAVPSAIGLAAIVGWRRRDDRWLVVLTLMTPVLAFIFVGNLMYWVFPWLRFFILAVPMGILLLGLAIGGIARAAETRPPASRLRRWLGTLIRGATIAAIVVAAILPVPAAAVAMLDPTIAVEESRDLAGLLGPGASSDDRPGADLHSFATEREIAGYLDGLHLPVGAVLVDAFSGFAIVAQSTDPRQFVITPDQDFQAVLADPLAFDIRFLLAPAPSGNGQLDALNTRYPALWSGGVGFARLERTFPGRGGSSQWSLFRIVSP